MRVCALFLILCTTCWSSSAAVLWNPALHSPSPHEQEVERVCQSIQKASKKYDLPESYLARLVWTRSEFREYAADTTGGLGVARLSSSVAREAGVIDRLNIEQSVAGTALYISKLRNEFGNEGLAAAAFHIGKKPFEEWMAGSRSFMPVQTENFVFEVTMQTAGSFLAEGAKYRAPPLKGSEQFVDSCIKLPTEWRSAEQAVERERLWSAIVAGSWRREAVLDQWESLSSKHPSETLNLHPTVQKWVTPLGRAGVYAAKVYTPDRRSADEICARLHKKGAPCVVLRN